MLASQFFESFMLPSQVRFFFFFSYLYSIRVLSDVTFNKAVIPENWFTLLLIILLHLILILNEVPNNVWIQTLVAE